MTTEEIIKEITSRDTYMVWRSSCEIISIGQDPEKIKPLIPYISLIKEKTDGLDMGGAFAPNQRFIDFALKTLEFHRNNDKCPCDLYDKHGLDPNKEVNKGFVDIIETTRIDGKWVDYYISICTRCQQKFKIIEREGHYMWWEWTKIN